MGISTPADEKSAAAARKARLAAARAKQKLSVVFEMPDLAVPGEVVSDAEMAFFVDNGFLIKKGILDPDKLAAAMDLAWSHLLAEVPVLEGSQWQLDRSDPSSWVNPQWAQMPAHPTSGPYQGRQPIEYYGRIVKLHDLGTDATLLDLFPNDPAVREVARTLLAEDLRPSTRTRGIYAVFPTENPSDPSGKRRLRGAALGPHTDQVCQQLNACAYLDDVAPRNGGFTVYPGSHKIMFRAHEYESNWSPLPTYRDAVLKVVDEIEPIELVAEKGAVDLLAWPHGPLRRPARRQRYPVGALRATSRRIAK